jgi:hypothetical protein
VRHLKLVSFLITLAGFVAVAAALAFGLNRTVLLVGLMLIVAGAFKIAAVAIWHGFAGFGVPLANDDPAPVSSRVPVGEEARR